MHEIFAPDSNEDKINELSILLSLYIFEIMPRVVL